MIYAGLQGTRRILLSYVFIESYIFENCWGRWNLQSFVQFRRDLPWLLICFSSIKYCSYCRNDLKVLLASFSRQITSYFYTSVLVSLRSQIIVLLIFSIKKLMQFLSQFGLSPIFSVSPSDLIMSNVSLGGGGVFQPVIT